MTDADRERLIKDVLFNLEAAIERIEDADPEATDRVLFDVHERAVSAASCLTMYLETTRDNVEKERLVTLALAL